MYGVSLHIFIIVCYWQLFQIILCHKYDLLFHTLHLTSFKSVCVMLKVSHVCPSLFHHRLPPPSCLQPSNSLTCSIEAEAWSSETRHSEALYSVQCTVYSVQCTVYSVESYACSNTVGARLGLSDLEPDYVWEHGLHGASPSYCINLCIMTCIVHQRLFPHCTC